MGPSRSGNHKTAMISLEDAMAAAGATSRRTVDLPDPIYDLPEEELEWAEGEPEAVDLRQSTSTNNTRGGVARKI